MKPIINTVSHQNWIRIYGNPGTFNEKQANQNQYGGNLTATTKAKSALPGTTSDTNPKGYQQWSSSEKVSSALDKTYVQNIDIRPAKAVMTNKVLPYGASNSSWSYDNRDNVKRERNATIGGRRAYYAVKLGNTGASRAYYGIVKAEVPVTKTPESQGQTYIRGFEVDELTSDEFLIPNITREGYICLDTITLKEHRPVNGAKAAQVVIQAQKVKGADGVERSVYPTEATLDSYLYTLTYRDRKGDETTRTVKASDLITKSDGQLKLEVKESVWNTAQEPLEHVKTVSMAVGHYQSSYEDPVSSHNTYVKKNESLFMIKGSPSGYIYAEDGNGDIGSNTDAIKELTLTADWSCLYETSSKLGTLQSSAQSEGTLLLSPSEATIKMTAVKDRGEGSTLTDVSYENEKDTYYHILLGNDSESAMSQPILRVELPLNDNEPKYTPYKTTGTEKADAPQEERRRGFQMTKIRLDKDIFGQPKATSSDADSTGELMEIRVYGYASSDESADADGNAPHVCIIERSELLKLCGPDYTIPFDAWYVPGSEEKCIKYPVCVELVFSSFGSQVKDDKCGAVDIYGQINRYADYETYPQQFAEKNGYDNALTAKATFKDYVAGTNSLIQSADGVEPEVSAAFSVKEPRPKVHAESYYYNRAGGILENKDTEDGDTQYNVVPYSREYLSVFGLTNDSISRMEQFRFEMKPDMGQDEGEPDRGFHTMDMIIRSKLFEEAVIDRITIVDDINKKKLVLTRAGYSPSLQPAPSADRNPYTQLPHVQKGEPAQINNGVIFNLALYDENGDISNQLPADMRTLKREGGDKDPSQVASLGKGLYQTFAGDLVIPRTLLISSEDESTKLGMTTISSVIIEGSDFLPMRADPGEESLSVSVNPNMDQTQTGSESVVFVGISDKEIKGNDNAVEGQKLQNAQKTENIGTFDTLLYSHTYEQYEEAEKQDTTKLVTGYQDLQGNNFAEIAVLNHKRSDIDETFVYTPRMFFDTTISAVFKDTPQDEYLDSLRFTDETRGSSYQDRNNTSWYYYCHSTGKYSTCHDEYNYKDNVTAKIGYKALAAYTVDFRQLGVKDKDYDAAYPNNLYAGWWEAEYSNSSQDHKIVETNSADYNTAANVDIAVSLPYKQFEAYYVKLRPALKPFVNHITVYPVEGNPYVITKWKNNADVQTWDGVSEDDKDDGWWRINLLAGDADRFKHQMIPAYDARVLTATRSDALYYETASLVKEVGSIDKVVLNLSINADPASGAEGTLWDAIAADEGTWYKEPKDPEIPPIKNGSSTGNPPYNSDYQTLEQATRHSMEIAGRVLKVGPQSAQVAARLELGNQFNMDASTSMDPYTVRQQDKVSHIRVQRPELYETWFGDGAGNVTTTVDGKQISIDRTDGNTQTKRPEDRTVLTGGRGNGKSSWSYRDWYAYLATNDHSHYKYAEWHAGHLEDAASMYVIPPVIRQKNGLGMPAGGAPFADPSGDITQNYPNDSEVPAYGLLRGYGLGIYQQNHDGIEIKSVRPTHMVEVPLRDDWYGRITHADYVSMRDTLPYIGRRDGLYKGFFSRYVEIADSIKPYLMNVEITVQQYKQDEDGNTVGKLALDYQNGTPEPVGDPIVYTIPYTDILNEYKAVDKQAPDELDGRILFCYDKETTGSLYGNDHLASSSDAELSSKGGPEQPGDPLNDEMLSWEDKYPNIIHLKKNQYPTQIAVRLVNVKGSAEQTDEYVVPNAYDPQHDEIEQHTNGKDPDWYAMGNVCDIAPDGKTFKLNALRSDSSVDPAQTETIPNTGVSMQGNYTTQQYGQKLANYADGLVGFLQKEEQIPQKPEELNDITVKEQAETLTNVDSCYHTTTEVYVEPVDSNKYWTHNYANLAMWYAKQKEPAGKVETNAVGLRDEGTPEERKRGTQIDPKKADSSAYDQLEKDNTVTPITDFYDYGADNKTPNSIRYRVWATNTTAKGNSTEIPGLDDSGVYYNELNYVDVLPE